MTRKSSAVRAASEFRAALRDGQTVKVIGLGGIGSIVARYGCVFLASVAGARGVNVRVVLVDGDSFEPSNTSRMLFSRMGNKAAVLREELAERFAQTRLSVEAMEEYVTRDNIARLVRKRDLVLLAVDNHATRKLVSDFCAGQDGWPGLDEVCLISGGNDGIGPDSTGRARRGTYGTCQVFIRRRGKDLSPSLTRHHQEIRRPADNPPGEKNCLEVVASAQQNLLTNLLAASSMLNALWLHLCGEGALRYSELAFDIAEGLMRPVRSAGEARSLPRSSETP
jgi:hypothetical protein